MKGLWKCPACGIEVPFQVTHTIGSGEGPKPDEVMDAIIGTLVQVRDELPTSSVERAKIETVIQTLRLQSQGQ